MFHFSDAENARDRIPEVHQTILERLGDSLPFIPQIAGHLLEEKKELLRSRMTVRCAEPVSYTHLTLPTTPYV